MLRQAAQKWFMALLFEKPALLLKRRLFFIYYLETGEVYWTNQR